MNSCEYGAKYLSALSRVDTSIYLSVLNLNRASIIVLPISVAWLLFAHLS